MKILQNPPASENWYIKEYCTGWNNSGTGCGAKLKIYRDDLHYLPPTENHEMGAVTFQCICCSELTSVGFSRWPENYKKLKPYKKKWSKT